MKRKNKKEKKKKNIKRENLKLLIWDSRECLSLTCWLVVVCIWRIRKLIYKWKLIVIKVNSYNSKMNGRLIFILILLMALVVFLNRDNLLIFLTLLPLMKISNNNLPLDKKIRKQFRRNKNINNKIIIVIGNLFLDKDLKNLLFLDILKMINGNRKIQKLFKKIFWYWIKKSLKNHLIWNHQHINNKNEI